MIRSISFLHCLSLAITSFLVLSAQDALAQFPQKGEYVNTVSDPHSNRSPLSKGQTLTESTGTRVTRLSDSASFSSTHGQYHQYSKRSAFNLDETKVWIGGGMVDLNSGKLYPKHFPTASESQWSNTDPNIHFGFVYQSNTFLSFNVVTGERRTLIQLNGYKNCRMGHGEGSVSNDDRYVVAACENNSNQLELISVDLEQGTVLGNIRPHSSYNWAGFSQSGRYIIVEHNDYPTNTRRELVRYDRFFNNETKIADETAHGDFGIDENGDDVYVMIAWADIRALRLKDGQITSLAGSNSNPAGHGHVSCRNILRPGYCYYSSYRGTMGSIEINFDRPGRVEMFGFHRSEGTDYNAQPKATASPSGQRIIFASNWYGRSEASTFMMSVGNPQQFTGAVSQPTNNNQQAQPTLSPAPVTQNNPNQIAAAENLTLLNLRVIPEAENAVRVQFDLNDYAQANIEYGLAGSFNQETGRELSFTYKDHEQWVRGLEEGRTYNLRINATNRNGVALSSNPIFFGTEGIIDAPAPAPAATVTTTPVTTTVNNRIAAEPSETSTSDLTLLDLRVIPGNPGTVSVEFDLSNFAQANLQYGNSKNFGSSTAREISFDYQNHRQAIRELEEGVTYYLRVLATDANGNTLVSEATSFTTEGIVDTPVQASSAPALPAEPEVEAPASVLNKFGLNSISTIRSPLKVNRIRIASLSPTSATVEFDLSDFAGGQIRYGTSKSLDQSTTREESFDYSDHIQTIRNLSPNTKYYFRVWGRDAEGNTAISRMKSFTTPGQNSLLSSQTTAQTTTPTAAPTSR